MIIQGWCPDHPSGVTPEAMEEVRPGLEAFTAQMPGPLARRDQRAKGEMYLRGRMLDGKRKSMQPMAERPGVDHQQPQQFVSSSTWDYSKIREWVARWAAAHISPEAYAIDDVGFPKDGYDSPGVARMYCGALGKRGNRQIGSVGTWSATAPPPPSTGACSFPRAGTTPSTTTTLCRPRRSDATAPRPASPRPPATGRSDAWPWTCSTRPARTGSCRICRTCRS